MHVGCISTENVNCILLDNILNMAFAVTANAFIGLPLFIGPCSWRGIFGYGWTICSKNVDLLQVINSNKLLLKIKFLPLILLF